METSNAMYIHTLEGAITGIAEREAEMGTISSYTVHIMRMVAEKAINKYVRTEAVAWLNDNADIIEELGGEA